MLAMNVNTKVKDPAWRLATFIDTDTDVAGFRQSVTPPIEQALAGKK